MPNSNVMGTLIKKFHKFYDQVNDGSVLERKCHRPSYVRSPENNDAVKSVKSGAAKKPQ
jgi:hypothetical protein